MTEAIEEELERRAQGQIRKTASLDFELIFGPMTHRLEENGLTSKTHRFAMMLGLFRASKIV